MTLQLKCIKVCQSVLGYFLSRFTLCRRMLGGGTGRKNNFSSEFSGCLVCPLHYSYVGWSLITCQAARVAPALKQLFYWPSVPALSVFTFTHRCYFTPIYSLLCTASQCHSSNSTYHRQDTNSKHDRKPPNIHIYFLKNQWWFPAPLSIEPVTTRVR